MTNDRREFDHQGATPDQRSIAPAFPSPRQEIQFAHDHGLIGWNQSQSGALAMQVVVSDERSARALKSRIEAAHGRINELAVRQSASQGGRWVVQVPVGQAERAGLLPQGVSYASVRQSLPLGAAPGDLYAAEQVRHRAVNSAVARNHQVIQAGASAAGLVQGTRNLAQSYRDGDMTGAAIAGTDVAASGLGTAIGIAGAVGKPVSPAFQGALTKINIGVILADGTYQVLREESAAHKVERGAAVAATTSTGAGVGSLLAGGLTAAGGAAATGTVAALTGAAAPVLVGGAAGYGTAMIAETAINTRRTYESEDKRFAATNDNRHLIAAEGRLAYKLRPLDLARTAEGRIDYADISTASKMRMLLRSEIRRCGETMAAHDSLVPRWLRWGPSVEKMSAAQSDLAIFTAAAEELHRSWKSHNRTREVSPSDNGFSEGTGNPNAPRDAVEKATFADIRAPQFPAAANHSRPSDHMSR